MKRYELRQNTREIRYRDRKEIAEGCTLQQENNQNPEILKSFVDKGEALKELEGMKSEIRKLRGVTGTYFCVTEYYVEENDYDEEGEWIGGGDVWGFSAMPEMEE